MGCKIYCSDFDLAVMTRLCIACDFEGKLGVSFLIALQPAYQIEEINSNQKQNHRQVKHPQSF